jgi:endoglucanase
MAYLSRMGPVWRGSRAAPAGPVRGGAWLRGGARLRRGARPRHGAWLRVRLRRETRLRHGVLLCVAAAVACVLPACSSGSPASTGQASTGQSKPGRPGHHRHHAAPRLHVSGNRLVNSHGRPVVLHGVDRSGTEFLCVQGHGIFDGPSDQASVSAMKSWGINAVRIPLNEACWNGEPYVPTAYSGANYQSAIRTYVNLLNANGMVAILDLHWTDGTYAGPSSACASAQARCLKPMPDAAQAIPFWTSVAQAFKGNDAVMFDLFNEPFPERAARNEAGGWQCWLHGGSCPGIGYQVAGMQDLVNAVRGTGARNVILLSGLAYSNDLTGWLANLPTDPAHNLAASWHSYNFNACSNVTCWTAQIAPVIAQVPLVAGEIGENDCASGYIGALTSWLDARSASYLAWAWNADFPCASGPSLITSYAGTPTGYGAGYQAHLRSLG